MGAGESSELDKERFSDVLAKLRESVPGGQRRLAALLRECDVAEIVSLSQVATLRHNEPTTLRNLLQALVLQLEKPEAGLVLRSLHVRNRVSSGNDDGVARVLFCFLLLPIFLFFLLFSFCCSHLFSAALFVALDWRV